VPIFIDVREPEEFAASHVAGAVNIPLGKVDEASMRPFAKDDDVVLYCRTGNRSSVAIQTLKQLGFTNLTNGINQEQVRVRYGV
jgi:phage shock protein E